jgi:hypothetical protein
MKEVCILYGNCHTTELRKLLTAVPEFSSRYEVEHILSYGDPPIPTDRIRRCSLLLNQVSRWKSPFPWANALPAPCRQVSFPVLNFQPLWPLLGQDPRRNLQRPEDGYDYGDSLAIKLSRLGFTRQQLFEEYLATDLRSFVNLDRFWEIAATRMREIDRQVDIPMYGCVEQWFRKERLFWAWNHPTHWLLLRLGEFLLRAVAGGAVPANLAARYLELPALGGVEIPIHPQVLSYYQIEWANPKTLYHFQGEHDFGWFTFEEFLWRYLSRGHPF